MKYNKYFLLAFIVFILLYIGFQTLYVRNHTKKEFEIIEKFEEKKETASEKVMKALENTIKTANTIGKRMLNPDVWIERMKLINKSPMELARMHIMSNS